MLVGYVVYAFKRDNLNLGYLKIRNHGIIRNLYVCGAWGHAPLIASLVDCPSVSCGILGTQTMGYDPVHYTIIWCSFRTQEINDNTEQHNCVLHIK